MKQLGSLLLALLFVGAGVMHLLRPEPFIAIVPPLLLNSDLPNAGVLVLLSGVAEIAGGVGILIPGLQRFARWGLVALLVAVFPANVYMALRHIEPAGIDIPEPLLWIRLLFQPLLIWWVLATTRVAP